MTKQLEGVFAPVVSTFHAETGELDVASFAANVRAHLNAGLHGIVVTGSTGEAALLDFAERGALVETCRELISADKWLIVGTGAESTRTTIKQTRDAADRLAAWPGVCRCEPAGRRPAAAIAMHSWVRRHVFAQSAERTQP